MSRKIDTGRRWLVGGKMEKELLDDPWDVPKGKIRVIGIGCDSGQDFNDGDFNILKDAESHRKERKADGVRTVIVNDSGKILRS